MLVQSPSLLITDDDREFRQTLRGAFEPQGFRTYLAADGEEALHIVRTQEVHLALMDMHMPRLTGLETIRLLKQIKALVPCILMSAQLDDFLISEAHRVQVYTVVAKPVTFRQILGVVRQALQLTYNWPVQGPPGTPETPR